MTRYFLCCLSFALLASACQTTKPVAQAPASTTPAKGPDQPSAENPRLADASPFKFVGPDDTNHLPTAEEFRPTSNVENPNATIHLVPPADPKQQP